YGRTRGRTSRSRWRGASREARRGVQRKTPDHECPTAWRGSGIRLIGRLGQAQPVLDLEPVLLRQFTQFQIEGLEHPAVALCRNVDVGERGISFLAHVHRCRRTAVRHGLDAALMTSYLYPEPS